MNRSENNRLEADAQIITKIIGAHEHKGALLIKIAKHLDINGDTDISLILEKAAIDFGAREPFAYGEVYKIEHEDKGIFTIILLEEGETWLRGRIISGEAQGELCHIKKGSTINLSKRKIVSIDIDEHIPANK